MTTTHIKNNAHKLAYLVKCYPDWSLEDVRKVLAWTLIDYNNAIWFLKAEGIIDIETRKISVPQPHPKNPKKSVMQEVDMPYGVFVKAPAKWEFGKDQDELQYSIEYMFEQVNATEGDLEEHYLNNYLNGYPPREHLIAVQYMLETEVLAEYQIEDGENNYLFYTLKKNEGKNWGQKQFKTNPLTGEDQTEKEADTTEAPTEE